MTKETLIRKMQYLPHQDSNSDELGIVLKLKTSSRSSCIEAPKFTKRVTTKSGEVINLPK
jgi:hypothetical protein